MSRRPLDQRRLVTAALSRPELDERRLETARLWAAARYPYLAGALFALRVRPIHRDGVMLVDRAWNLHLDPWLATRWDPEELGATLLHHIQHLLRDHAGRAETLGVGRELSRRWATAADAEIDDDLADAGVTMPLGAVLPSMLGCEPYQLAEVYYRAPWQFSGRPRLRDCGSGADGLPREGDAPQWLSPAQADALRDQTALDTVAHEAANPGTVPGGLLRWARSRAGSRVDWRKELGAEIRRGVAAVSGMVDYSYRRPSRRAAKGVVLPAFVRPLPELAIVVDTSGSVDQDLLDRALGEVDTILRRLGQRRVTVIPCDAIAYGVQRLTSARQVELIGGGGTDMGRGIEAAQALRPPADVVVVLTDGYTPWPGRAPARLRVVVGLLEGGSASPPEWARVVRIHEAL